MAYKFAGQNKLVQRELVTKKSAYQQCVAIYDVLADIVRRDPRMLGDSKSRQAISRSQNLLHGESTDIFRNGLQDLERYVASNPNPSEMDYKTVVNLLCRPNSIFKGESDQIRGWHGGEVHHMVPAAGIATMTSTLPYKRWGNTIYETAQTVPLTSSAFNGVENRSGPGHNLSHLDVLGRQFYKGDAPGSIIANDSLDEDAIHQLTDFATASHMISKIGGAVDSEVFLPQLAEAVSQRVGRCVDPAEFSSTKYSSEGRGRTEAAHLRGFTDADLVTKVTEESYGGVDTDGAEEFLNQRGIYVIKSPEERRLETNAKARKRRKEGVKATEPVALLRPDIEEVLAYGGKGYENLLGLKLN